MWGSDWPRRLEIMSTCLIFVLYFIIGSRPRDTKKQLVVFTLFIPKMGLGGKGGGGVYSNPQRHVGGLPWQWQVVA